MYKLVDSVVSNMKDAYPYLTEKKKISFKGHRSEITPILDTVDKEIQYENMNFKERRQAKKEEKLASKGIDVKAKAKKEPKKITKEEPIEAKKDKVKPVISPIASFATDSLSIDDDKPKKVVEVAPIRQVVNAPKPRRVEIKPIDLEEDYFDDDIESHNSIVVFFNFYGNS